jgi:hypothetical protein
MTHDYNHPNAFVQEGVDHINISARSTTRLGKVFDPSYFKAVSYPHIGKFGSVMNLWYWLRSDPVSDVLRRATGEKLRKHLLEQKCNAYVPNFRAIIAVATYEKIKSYPDTIEEIKRLSVDIPFVSYYTPQSSMLRVCSNYANVMVPIAEMIREALLKGVEPDFTTLLPTDADPSYDYVGPFLKKRFPKMFADAHTSDPLN